MASMNTRLNIKKLDGNIVPKHRGSKQVGLKQLSSKQVGIKQLGVKQVEMYGAQGNHEIEDFQAEDTTRSTNLVNMSPSSAIRFKKPIDILGIFGWLASIKQGMLESVKVKCIFSGYHKSIVGNKLWRLDDVTSKVVLYRNMGFNESGEYKKTFIGSGVGTGSMQVLHRFKFEVEPLGDHTFELARDREQHLACELFRYREDSNEAAFVVAAVEIYSHESMTFNNTVACKIISKWKAGLKDDIDARSDVYVLSNGCRKCSDDSDGHYWEYTPAKGNVLGMKIVKDQSGNTLRVSESRFYNGKLVQTLLEGHSILSLEGSPSGVVMWKRIVSGHVYMRLEARNIRWSARDLTQHMQM
ncbi:hypothetical protein Tco_0625603 [Tanacetum coccineum]|uniref:Zinc finger, CCHC-type n=1 Tax=Tanacetum coccineum TaxID=301880 RepID=A0ABQ4WHB5_9ASTR